MIDKHEDNHWTIKALCRNEWELFDADDETDTYKDSEEAVRICGMCTVRPQCRIAGQNERTGIWAGEIKEGK